MAKIIWQIILQVILIFLNAVFACAEIAVLSINENKLDKLSAEGDKKAKRLKKLKSNPAKFLATIQVGITLAGYLGAAFAADSFSDLLINKFVEIGLKDSLVPLIKTLCVIAITLILAYFSLVFGELVPKRLAMKKAEKLALFMSKMVYVLSKIFAPIVWLLTVSTNGVLRVLGINPNSSDVDISKAEEEIRLMVDAAGASGGIKENAKEMIQNIFEFDDLMVSEIMTHRVEASLLWLEDDVKEWEKTIFSETHTYYPICSESVDNVVGVLNTKLYFRLGPNPTKEKILDVAVKPPFFVPETVKADKLFSNMQATHNRIAIVMDEYGGFSGLVTMNDLLQELVGDFEEEPEEVAIPQIIQIGEKTWRVLGETELDEINKELGLPVNNEDGIETLNGLVYDLLGYIPEDGSLPPALEYNGITITVDKVDNRNIVSAVLTDNRPDEEDEEEDKEEKKEKDKEKSKDEEQDDKE